MNGSQGLLQFHGVIYPARDYKDLQHVGCFSSPASLALNATHLLARRIAKGVRFHNNKYSETRTKDIDIRGGNNERENNGQAE